MDRCMYVCVLCMFCVVVFWYFCIIGSANLVVEWRNSRYKYREYLYSTLNYIKYRLD